MMKCYRQNYQTKTDEAGEGYHIQGMIQTNEIVETEPPGEVRQRERTEGSEKIRKRKHNKLRNMQNTKER